MSKLTIILAIVFGTIIYAYGEELKEIKDEIEVKGGYKLISENRGGGPDKYYWVFRETLLTLGEAKRACELLYPPGHQIKTRLVCIETMTEMLYIGNELKRVFGVSKNLTIPNRSNRDAYWTCGIDLYLGSKPGSDGQYWFYSGVPILPQLFNPTEPNDDQTGVVDGCGAVSETCIDLKIPAKFPNSNFGLNDELCNTRLSYICETQDHGW